jgi:uncharacterized membrane protein YoaK (UPF0700 family)
VIDSQFVRFVMMVHVLDLSRVRRNHQPRWPEVAGPTVRHRATALAFIAGSVDTFSFLTLSGLFAAHVTGNFVILAATLVLGHPAGVWSKVLAVPLFAAGVGCASLLAGALRQHRRNVWRPLFGIELVLLIAALVISWTLGPFPDADRPTALLLAVLLILAMSTQSAARLLAVSGEPPSVAMTTNMTRLFVHVTALLAGNSVDGADHEKTRAAAYRFAEQCAAFLIGCAVGAGGYVLAGSWVLAIPTVLIATLLFSFDAP